MEGGSRKGKIVADEIEETLEQPEDDVTPEDVLGVISDEEPDAEPGGDGEVSDEAPTDDAGEDKEAESEEELEGEAEVVEPAEDAESQAAGEDGLIDYTVNYGGDEFAVRVTPAQAKILDAQNKTALQFPHLQKKREEELRAWQMAQAAQNAVQQATGGQQQPGDQPTPSFQPEAFVQRMKPELDAAVQRGAISEDFAEFYPVEAASLVWAGHLADELISAVGTMGQHYVETTHDAEVQAFTTQVYSEMQNLAESSPDVFGELATPENKESFLNFMIETDLPVASLQGDRARDTLARQYAAWMGPKLTYAAQAAAERARSDDAEARRNARGGGGGGGARTKPKDGLEDIREILG